MFSEKINSWKNIIIGFAGFGFVLSFILGIIGRVFIGAIILRAILFAVVFAGISLLLLKLIEAFIPELLSSDSELDEEDESSIIIEDSETEGEPSGIISGGNLDITIEDDEDSFTPGSGGYEELETVESAKPVEAGDTVDGAAGSSESMPAAGPDAVSAEAASLTDDLEELEEAEVVEAVEELQEVGNSGVVAAKKAGGEAGALPDIGTYSDSFEQTVGTVDGDGLGNIDGMGSSGAEILGGIHDTDEIVKAVKTVLKKDQEG